MVAKTQSDFPRRLRQLRTAAGLSVTELAEAAGLTRQQVRYLEIGHSDPKLTTLCKLARALGQKSLSCWD